MQKEDFYKILCSYTPEELNEFISSKGTKKLVNAITFINKESNPIEIDSNQQLASSKAL